MSDSIAVPKKLLIIAMDVCKKLRRRNPSIQEVICVAEFLGHYHSSPDRADQVFKSLAAHQVPEETIKAICERVTKELDPTIERKLEEWIQPPRDLYPGRKNAPLAEEQKKQIIRLAERNVPPTQIAREMGLDARRVAGYVRTMINAGKIVVSEGPKRKL